MKDQYTFKINNLILQYHNFTNTFRICLEDFKDMCLVIDKCNNFNNFYVLNKIPEEYTLYDIKLIKTDIQQLNDGDLIYTPEKYKTDITEYDIQQRYNFALIVSINRDKLNLVRVLGNSIEYICDAYPKTIYKVQFDKK